MGFLENLLNRYIPRTPGEPVFAVIDTETTGFKKGTDRIIELAAVLLDDTFTEVGAWHTLINPGGKNITNSSIHGITNDMVAHAPQFEDIITDFASFIDNMVLIAHNAPFDAKMLLGEINRFDSNDSIYLPFVDSIALAKQELPTGPYRLSSLLQRLGVDNPRAHAAVDDAAATGAMLKALYTHRAREVAHQILRQTHTFDARPVANLGLAQAQRVTR